MVEPFVYFFPAGRAGEIFSAFLFDIFFFEVLNKAPLKERLSGLSYLILPLFCWSFSLILVVFLSAVQSFFLSRFLVLFNRKYFHSFLLEA